MKHNQQVSDDLRKIAEGVAAATGEAFFRSLVENLALSLQVDYAFVVRVSEEGRLRGKTIAGYGRGKVLGELEYDLEGTPCRDVIRKQICCFPAGVRQLFPSDAFLVDAGIESYAGIPLVDAAGRVLGLIAVMHGRPLARPELAISALQIWAARASAELERLATEQALRESQAILEKAQAVGQVGSWISDPDPHGRLSWSREACRIFGVAPAEFDGRVETFFALVYPEDLPRVLEASRSALAGERSYDIEHRIMRADGQVRWVLQQADVERDADGRPTRMVGVVQDITERKLADEALRASENRFRTIFDSEPECVKLLDAGGRLLEMNRAGLAMVGAASADQVVGQCVLPLVVPEHRGEFEALLARVMRGESGSLSFEMLSLSGTRRWMDTHASPLRDATGQIIAGLFVARDITAQRQAERQLRDSEERFRALVEHGFEGINIIDLQGNLLYASPANHRMLGYRPEEVVGRDGLRFLHPDDMEIAFNLLRKLGAEPQQVFSPVLRIKHKDGSWRWVEMKARNMLAHPAVRGIVVNWRDITDRKLAEEKLATQQAELLHASRLSTMGQMVATMSHEISQPLSAMGNFSAACAKLLQTTPPADPELFRGYVHEISRQAQRAAAIVKRLRTFGAKSTPDQELCDLNWLLRDSVELVASELRRHGVTVRWELAEPAPRIAVDRVQFQQVIVNLLTNACDAMLDVDPERRVVAVRSFVQPDAAVIEIIDRGIGLPADVMKSLFQPFFTTKPDGMGLGLSICREIVEDHSGQIEAISCGRSGATFRVRMPLGDGKPR